MENLENEPRGRSKSIERRKRNRKAEEKSDPRKGLDASRMTSGCKRIGMIRYSFLKQEDKYREIDQEPIRSRASQIALQKLQEYTRNLYGNCRKMK